MNVVKSIVQVSLKKVVGSRVLVSMFRSRCCVLTPVNAPLGIGPKTLVIVMLLKSAGSETEEYCRLAVSPLALEPRETCKLMTVNGGVNWVKLANSPL